MNIIEKIKTVAAKVVMAGVSLVDKVKKFIGRNAEPIVSTIEVSKTITHTLVNIGVSLVVKSIVAFFVAQAIFKKSWYKDLGVALAWWAISDKLSKIANGYYTELAENLTERVLKLKVVTA